MQPAPLWNGNPKSTQRWYTCYVLTCRCVRFFFAGLHEAARATCHVPPIDPRPAPTSFRRFGASIGGTPVPIGPAVRVLFTKVLGHIHTRSGQLFSATHRRKSSFITTYYAKGLAPFILYDFGLEAGIAKHCLGPKS